MYAIRSARRTTLPLEGLAATLFVCFKYSVLNLKGQIESSAVLLSVFHDADALFAAGEIPGGQISLSALFPARVRRSVTEIMATAIALQILR